MMKISAPLMYHEFLSTAYPWAGLAYELDRRLGGVLRRLFMGTFVLLGVQCRIA